MTTQIKPVTIPREVADAIERFRSSGSDNERILYAVVNPTRDYNDMLTHLRQIPFDTLLSALVNGYERELTEEEKREQAYADIHAIYVHHYDTAFETYSDGYCDGIEYVLNTLGIVIPGINEGGAA